MILSYLHIDNRCLNGQTTEYFSSHGMARSVTAWNNGMEIPQIGKKDKVYIYADIAYGVLFVIGW